MSKPKPRWKGTRDFREQPTSPVFENTKEGPRYTRTFRGPYAKLVSDQPKRMQAMVGSPTDFFVDTVRVAKMPGGSGEMTVSLTPAPVEDYTFDSKGEVLELEWTESQKKLEEHPAYKPGGSLELSRPDRAEIEEWKNADSKTQKELVYSTLTDNAKNLVDKLARGHDSYVSYSPVCRKTTRHAQKPTATKCGVRNDPPATIKVEGYVYLKTADRVTRDRTWSRVQEWTGAEEIDEDIYEEA